MDRKTDLRLWAVLFWLAVWQIAAMALAAVYPHGELLLASPVNVLLRLGQLAVTAAFWRTVAWSAIRIFGGFLISTVLAVVLAALAAWKTWFRELMAPVSGGVSRRCRWRPSSFWPWCGSTARACPCSSRR